MSVATCFNKNTSLIKHNTVCILLNPPPPTDKHIIRFILLSFCQTCVYYTSYFKTAFQSLSPIAIFLVMVLLSAFLNGEAMERESWWGSRACYSDYPHTQSPVIHRGTDCGCFLAVVSVLTSFSRLL